MAVRIYDNKQYGDQKSLDRLQSQASGLKQGAGDALPTQRNPVGRPEGALGPQNAPTVPLNGSTVVQTTGTIPPEHQQIMEAAARKIALAQMASGFQNDPLAGPWLTEYAARLRSEAEDAAKEVRDLTPNFNGLV